MPNQPLAEVFGFPINDMTEDADRHRRHRLCTVRQRCAELYKDQH